MFFFLTYCIFTAAPDFYYQIAENMVDPVYNIKAIRGMLTEMKKNTLRPYGYNFSSLSSSV